MKRNFNEVMAQPECLDYSFEIEDVDVRGSGFEEETEEVSHDSTGEASTPKEEEEDWECFADDDLNQELSDEDVPSILSSIAANTTTACYTPRATVSPSTDKPSPDLSAVTSWEAATTPPRHLTPATMPPFFHDNHRPEYSTTCPAPHSCPPASTRARSHSLPMLSYDLSSRPTHHARRPGVPAVLSPAAAAVAAHGRLHHMGLTPSKPLTNSFDFSISSWRAWRSQSVVKPGIRSRNPQYRAPNHVGERHAMHSRAIAHPYWSQQLIRTKPIWRSNVANASSYWPPPSHHQPQSQSCSLHSDYQPRNL